jgi:hypothetical protein
MVLLNWPLLPLDATVPDLETVDDHFLRPNEYEWLGLITCSYCTPVQRICWCPYHTIDSRIML